MAVALAQQRQNLSMSTPPVMDVASLVGESNGMAYPTSSSASTVRPRMLPTSMPEPAPTSTMDNGRIYRYV